MTINVQGMLKQPDSVLKGLFVDEDDSPLTAGEVRAYLFSKLDEGYRVVPMSGKECEGFDKVKGCPGHPIE